MTAMKSVAEAFLCEVENLQEAVRIYQEGKEKEVLLLSEDMVEVGPWEVQ